MSVAEAEQRLTAIQAELFRPGTGHQLELRNQVRDLLKTQVGLRVFKDAFAAATAEHRTNLLLVAALSPTQELLPLLTPAMQSPSAAQHAKQLNRHTDVDVDLQNSLISTDVFLDGYLKSGADAKTLDDVIDRADPQIARYIGVQLASKGALTSDAAQHLMARDVDAKRFRRLTEQENRAVTRPNFGSRSAKPKRSASLASPSSATQSSNSGPITPPPTISTTRGRTHSIGTGTISPGAGDQPCLVSEWWDGNTDTLDFWFGDSYCTDSLIGDAWNRFHMGDGRAGWAQPYGYDEPCNMDYPLARVFAGIYVLNYAGTWSPDCNYDGSILNWASCYAGSNISWIQPDCEDSGTLAAQTADNAVSGDDHTDLFPTYFFNSTIIARAADLFHEGRHAEAVCNHVTGCAGGGRNCDPSYGPGGCVGPLSGDGDGAYTFTVKYYIDYLRSGQDALINDTIRQRIEADINTLLVDNFVEDPCFRVTDIYGSTETSCPDASF